MAVDALAIKSTIGMIRDRGRVVVQSPMRIAISSIGRFHMFDLTRQMVKLGQDVRLYTGYPKFKVDSDLKPITKTRPYWVMAEYLRHHMRPAPRTTWWADHALEDFAPWLARHIGEADILDALAGTGWEAGRVMHNRGGRWICNRGSSHILTQKQLLEEEHTRWQLRPPFFDMGRPLERCLGEYAEADAIVVPSEFARRSFLDHGVSSERLYKCPYGVDLTLFSPRPVAKENHRFRVVFVGGASLRKGIGYFLEAMQPLVKDRVVETWLIGAIAPEARAIVSNHAGEFIHQGVQPRAKLAEYLSRSDVMVLPSIEEGLALVQAQAMACGLPVIATPNTGAEELFTHGVEGFIVPIRDPKAVREKVEWMLDNPVKRQEMGTAALQRVKSLGGWDRYGERCLEIYRKVLCQKIN